MAVIAACLAVFVTCNSCKDWFEDETSEAKEVVATGSAFFSHSEVYSFDGVVYHSIYHTMRMDVVNYVIDYGTINLIKEQRNSPISWIHEQAGQTIIMNDDAPLKCSAGYSEAWIRSVDGEYREGSISDADANPYFSIDMKQSGDGYTYYLYIMACFVSSEEKWVHVTYTNSSKPPETVSYWFSLNNYDGGIGDIYIDINTEDMERFLANPASEALVIPINIELEGYLLDGFGNVTSEYEYYKLSGTVTLNAKLPEVECHVKTKGDYENWLPKGHESGNNTVNGNLLLLSANLHKKGVPDEGVPQRRRYKIVLKDVTREKGVCNNYPLDGNDDYDLKIQPDANLEVSDDGQSALSDWTDKELDFFVASYDYGAYGVVEVTAILENNEMIQAYFNNDNNDHYLEVPRDDNGNFIADAWEDLYPDVKGKTPEWDEDPYPAGQLNDGDGYTLYEEYRGFTTKKGADTHFHIRTNPTIKDLFICDISLDELVKTNFGDYESTANPAQLMLHSVSDIPYKGGKTPQERCTNFNSTTFHYADQYALVVDEKDFHKDSKYILGAAEDFDNKNTALKDVYIVNIYTNAHIAILSGEDANAGYVFNLSGSELERFYKDFLKNTVIHEIGHALGIEHHGGGDGEIIEPKEDWQVPINTQRPWYYGVSDCAMRYNRHKEQSYLTYLFDRHRYCRKGETWSVTIEGKARTFDSHNCWGQINVKMKP